MPSTPPEHPLSTPRKSPAGPGRPKDLEKRAAILHAAQRLFLDGGYDRVSMDQIALDAGVSKLTVYRHFGDKDLLFGAAVRAKCEELLPSRLLVADPVGPIRQQLAGIARALHGLLTSRETIAIQRLLSAQTLDSRLSALFWSAGPQRVHDAFVGFLQAQVAAGHLQIADLHRAASQFFCLLKGELHARLLCGCPDQMTAEALDAHVEATVDFFLKAYQR